MVISGTEIQGNVAIRAFGLKYMLSNSSNEDKDNQTYMGVEKALA